MSTALARAHKCLTEAVQALQDSKAEVPAHSVEALVFVRAEIKVIRRRITNIAKAIGDPAS